MRYVRACASALLLACAPDDIVMARCESEMLALYDPYHCTIDTQLVGRPSSIYFDTTSTNQVAQVHLELRVEAGTLEVTYHDLEGEKKARITPKTPLVLDLQTRMHRERRYFPLHFVPLSGQVRGVHGTVDYKTP